MIESKSLGSKIFDIFNHTFLLLVGLIALLPFVYIVITSFSATSDLIPKSFTTEAYEYIFSADTFTKSLLVSVFVTLVGTLVQLTLSCLMAYSLSHTHLPGRSFFLMMVLITMLFSGGMIPTYFVVQQTGLLNSLWALIIPNAISAFYLIILKNFFQSIPNELKESAKIDGAHELTVLFRIVLPLSLPALAAFGLFYAVGIWNQYFNAILYISDPALYPVQVILRQLIILSSGAIGDSTSIETIPYHGQAIQMAVIVVATLPIIILYPFLQKHFAKGVLLGSVKG